MWWSVPLLSEQSRRLLLLDTLAIHPVSPVSWFVAAGLWAECQPLARRALHLLRDVHVRRHTHMRHACFWVCAQRASRGPMAGRS